MPNYLRPFWGISFLVMHTYMYAWVNEPLGNVKAWDKPMGCGSKIDRLSLGNQ